CQHYFTSPYSF
nr:immunoglobulin light chain junction region [Macaca mulatta]MOX49232.1 immunoglobulin light chain junction region [Macaca mulatta]MOX49256.1 immunoglobulin light chain junction region [Macaca mulatta]MOX49464.1 immunoglobulin light chain junction region [Macaca mulatta]MOX49825.1 immunoglobulin light chain junction region [Macaca mulatta]